MRRGTQGHVALPRGHARWPAWHGWCVHASSHIIYIHINIMFRGPPCIRGQMINSLYSSYLIYWKISSFSRCGTNVLWFVLIADAWRRMDRWIMNAMERVASMQWTWVHQIAKSRTWFKKDLSESRSTVHLKSYNGHD